MLFKTVREVGSIEKVQMFVAPNAHVMLVLCPTQSMLTLGTGRWSCTRAEDKILFVTALLLCIWKIKDAAQDCSVMCISNVNVLLFVFFGIFGALSPAWPRLLMP